MSEAVALAEALLVTVWPAQVLKIRVDVANGHRVAGITLSGTKFHEPLDADQFLREVRSLAVTAFGSAPVEEVDLWAIVPSDAKATSETVFSATVRRTDLPHLDTWLRSNNIFWDAVWRSQLEKRQRRQL